MLRMLQSLVLIALLSVGPYRALAHDTRVDKNPAPIVVIGEIRALGLLGMTSVNVPWNRTLTIGRIILELGGVTEYASHIVVTVPGKDAVRYSIKEFNKEEFRKKALAPGTIVQIDHTFD